MDRDDPELERWARAVKVNAGFVCEICGAKGVYLESHHKNGFNAFPEQRTDLFNGACLCSKCHQSFHEQFQYGGNTEYQYQQYKEIATVLRKIAEESLKEKP